MRHERTPTVVPGPQCRRSFGPVLGLLLLAPLIGEYLLGNVPIRDLPALPFLVPLYGGGALLIREVARRAHRGWATILILGAAYGLIEAGLFDGALFNPSFEGLDFTATYLPALGISATNALHFIVGHAVWSIAIPIALIEALVPGRPSTPWLGNVGLAITAVAYLLGGLLIQHGSRSTGNYLTSTGQLAGTVLVALALILVALYVGRRAPTRVRSTAAPRPLLVGTGAFITSSLFIAVPEDWLGVALAVVLLIAASVVVAGLSQLAGWRESHRLAVAGGALLTYAWAAFVVAEMRDNTDAVSLAGNVIFAVGALILLAVAMCRTARQPGPTGR